MNSKQPVNVHTFIFIHCNNCLSRAHPLSFSFHSLSQDPARMSGSYTVSSPSRVWAWGRAVAENWIWRSWRTILTSPVFGKTLLLTCLFVPTFIECRRRVGVTGRTATCITTSAMNLAGLRTYRAGFTSIKKLKIQRKSTRSENKTKTEIII